MDTVTVSATYHLRIPPPIREALHIEGGDKMAVVAKHGTLQYVPVRAFTHTKGTTPGLTTENLRDEQDRF
jgi:bifunctional DNA-binding transcriptional regulator/antitoxin component of YhaV-PrlF toxin-antitoxin module